MLTQKKEATPSTQGPFTVPCGKCHKLRLAVRMIDRKRFRREMLMPWLCATCRL